MQKWDYCRVWIRYSDLQASLLKMTDKGQETVADLGTIRKSLPKGTKLDHEDFVGQTIAQLGEEGWEMVGITVDMSYSTTFYFKRPKQ